MPRIIAHARQWHQEVLEKDRTGADDSYVMTERERLAKKKVLLDVHTNILDIEASMMVQMMEADLESAVTHRFERRTHEMETVKVRLTELKDLKSHLRFDILSASALDKSTGDLFRDGCCERHQAEHSRSSSRRTTGKE